MFVVKGSAQKGLMCVDHQTDENEIYKKTIKVSRQINIYAFSRFVELQRFKVFLFCFIMMIRNFRFELILYLVFTDDNIQYQPFDQLVHHEIQLKQMAVLLRKQKSIHCHVSYIRIVYMQELPIPAQGLDRCMTIFTRGFHVYGSHCPPQNSSQFIARFPPLTTSTHIYIWKR